MSVASDFPSKRYHVTSLELNCVFNLNYWFIDSRLMFMCVLIKKIIGIRKQAWYHEYGEWKHVTCFKRESGEIRVVFLILSYSK